MHSHLLICFVITYNSYDMNTILHCHHLGALRGFLVSLLLALCLPSASAQETVTGSMKGDSIFVTVKGVKFYFYNHGHDSLTIDNATLQTTGRGSAVTGVYNLNLLFNINR